MAGLCPVERLSWLAVVASDRSIKESGLRVSIALASHQNKKTGRLDPSMGTLAYETGMTERVIPEAIRQLVNAGYLEKLQINRGGRGKKNSYRLVVKGAALETMNSDSLNNDSQNGHSLNNDSENPEPPFQKTMNDGSPEQGIEQGKNKEDNRNRKNAVTDDAEEDKFYISKRKRKLKGKQLEWFNLFWKAFDLKRGRAEAADSWINLKITEELLPDILKAAKSEARTRTKPGQSGPSPKWPQGWLSSRRWEDGIPDTYTTQTGAPYDDMQTIPAEENW